jgi:hypothetical protein
MFIKDETGTLNNLVAYKKEHLYLYGIILATITVKIKKLLTGYK